MRPDPTPRPTAPRSSGRIANPWRLATWVAIGVALVTTAVAFWALRQLSSSPVGLEVRGPAPAHPKEKPPDRLVLRAASFDELEGWEDDRLADALAAFVVSCAAKNRSAGGALATQLAAAPSVLSEACARARAAAADSSSQRALVEELFSPWQVLNNAEPEGLFTGYYEPELRGARRKRTPFVHPLYLAPRDQMTLDLGEFKADLAGRKITGMIRGGRFRPYWDRAEIEGGALAGRGLEMLWVDDPVALFFLQIQGSGRVVLPDGALVRVGYASQNGHDYTAIGKVLIEMGELERERVSLQTIRAWLLANPTRAEAVMAKNRSYVFFRVLPGAPVGSSGVELTPGRSLAIDPKFLPYGLPIWLETTYPATDEAIAAAPATDSTPSAPPPTGPPLRRLVVSQDSGGAIRGPVRGDLFWGAGEEAEAIAGRMKQRGRLWLLWPKAAPPPEPAAVAR